MNLVWLHSKVIFLNLWVIEYTYILDKIIEYDPKSLIQKQVFTMWISSWRIRGDTVEEISYEFVCKSKPQWGAITRQSGWLLSKSLQAINAGKGVEKREPSYTVGGNAN